MARHMARYMARYMARHTRHTRFWTRTGYTIGVHQNFVYIEVDTHRVHMNEIIRYTVYIMI